MTTPNSTQRVTTRLTRKSARHFNLFSLYYQKSLVEFLNAASLKLNGKALTKHEKLEVRKTAAAVMSRAA